MRAKVSSAIAQSQALVELVAMREQLVAELQTWLKTAEASNSATLCEFAAMLSSARA